MASNLPDFEKSLMTSSFKTENAGSAIWGCGDVLQCSYKS